MSKKKYLVVEQATEYNDEYNMIQEEGYTIASNLYETKEDARKFGMRKAILKLFIDYKGKFDSSSFDFHGYGEDDECIKLKDFMVKKGWAKEGDFDDNYEVNLPKDLTEDEVIQAYDKWDIDLFQIIEVIEVIED